MKYKMLPKRTWCLIYALLMAVGGALWLFMSPLLWLIVTLPVMWAYVLFTDYPTDKKD